VLISHCIKEFIDDRRYRNLSTKTIQGYQIVLDLFRDYCAKHEIVDINDVTNATVKGFLLHLQNERNNNPTSRNSKLRTIKTFFNFLVESEIINDKQNPTRKINFAREEIDIKPFTDEQIKKMLGYLRSKRQIAPTCPSNEGLDKLVYGQDIRQVSGNDDDQGSN